MRAWLFLALLSASTAAPAEFIPPPSEALPYPEGGKGATIAVQLEPILTGANIAAAEAGFDVNDGSPVIFVTFDAPGRARFGVVTGEYVGRQFAILIDGIVVSAPYIREPILGGTAQIAGAFSEADAEAMAGRLRSGQARIEFRIVE